MVNVENKHVKCLQYKCPLCRANKGTRLAYESHLRRAHGAKVKDYNPGIRCRKRFCVKYDSQTDKECSQPGEQYDLQFVTFLRTALEKNGSYAEWVDQDHGIFRINNRYLCARMWYSFKVAKQFVTNKIMIFLTGLRGRFLGRNVQNCHRGIH